MLILRVDCAICTEIPRRKYGGREAKEKALNSMYQRWYNDGQQVMSTRGISSKLTAL